MNARGYELDEAVRTLKETVRKLDLKTARARVVSGANVTYDPTLSPLLVSTDLQAVIDEIAAGGLDVYLRSTLGGKEKTQNLGTLGATATADLAVASVFQGLLDQDCTIGFTGWTAGVRCTIGLSLTEDGTGGWTPTLSGVTWIGGAPTWDTTAGTVTHVVLFSDDGTTIYAGVLGGGGSTSTGAMVPYYIAPGDTFTVPLYKQALFEMTITNDGILVVDGFLVAVS